MDVVTNHIDSAASGSNAASEVLNVGRNWKTYQATPTSAGLDPVLNGIASWMADSSNLASIRLLEKNPTYSAMQDMLEARRSQQCADLLEAKRLMTKNTVPQAVLDCVCGVTCAYDQPYYCNVQPYFVCNAMLHQAVIPTAKSFVNASAPKVSPAASGRRLASARPAAQLFHPTHNPFRPGPSNHDKWIARKRGLPVAQIHAERRRLQELPRPVAASPVVSSPTPAQARAPTPAPLPASGATKATSASPPISSTRGAANLAAAPNSAAAPNVIQPPVSADPFAVLRPRLPSVTDLSAVAVEPGTSVLVNNSRISFNLTILEVNPLPPALAPLPNGGAVYKNGGTGAFNNVASGGSNPAALQADSGKGLGGTFSGDCTASGLLSLAKTLLTATTPTKISCKYTFPTPVSFVIGIVTLQIDLPSVNFAKALPGDNSNSLTVCDSSGKCTTFCPSDTATAQCPSGQLIDRKIINALSIADAMFMLAFCASVPDNPELNAILSALFTLFGLNPCFVEVAITLKPFAEELDGFLAIGFAFFEIQALATVRLPNTDGTAPTMCTYLTEGSQNTIVYGEVQCNHFCYDKPGDGHWEVDLNVHFLIWSATVTLISGTIGTPAPPLCKYHNGGYYDPKNGRPSSVGPGSYEKLELLSNNQFFLLKLEDDWNFVVYGYGQSALTNPDHGPGDNIVWQSDKHVGPIPGVGAPTVNLTADGLLSIIIGMDTADYFSTDTANYAFGNAYLALGDDGDLKIFDDHNNVCIWSALGFCHGVPLFPKGLPSSLTEIGNPSETYQFQDACLLAQYTGSYANPYYGYTQNPPPPVLVSPNRLYALFINNLQYTNSNLYVARAARPQDIGTITFAYAYAPGNAVWLTQPTCKINNYKYHMTNATLCLHHQLGLVSYETYLTNTDNNLAFAGLTNWKLQNLVPELPPIDNTGPMRLTLTDEGFLTLFDYTNLRIYNGTAFNSQFEWSYQLPPGSCAGVGPDSH
ncbi:hypothetical protein WJX72_008071 [[Myrmecia] bisecta]|uniref:Bulb-type lectin domain-containing protein n=1 Tax=[Myrmecia] bisecta TaxID=41462 RepID=A0AAW1QRL8_9CHLO